MKLIIILAGFKKNIIKYEFFRIRAYAQFSMFSQAIKYFEKSMYIWNERELSNEITCENGKEYDKKENIFKECVYNLVIIHKKMGNKVLAAQLVSNFLKL